LTIIILALAMPDHYHCHWYQTP